MKEDPSVVEETPREISLEEDWDDFNHEYVGEPKAEAFWRDGLLYVNIYVTGQHWIGSKNPQHHIKQGMGFILRPRDMLMLAKDGETPYRQCPGFRRCVECRNSTSPVEKR